MASNLNQIRLQQISGSLAAMTPSSLSTQSAPASLGETSVPDLQAILKYFAQSLSNLHGDTDFGTNPAGQITHAQNNVLLQRTASSGAASLNLQLSRASDADSVAVKLEAGSGSNDETLSLINTAGTTDGSEGGGSIVLEATAGGIGLHAADDKDIWVEGGRAVVTANEDAAAAIKLHADAGAAQTIQILNDAGTVDGTEGAGAIDIEATVGGISIHAADDKDIWVEGGQAVVTANHDTAAAIKLHADAGAAQTIQLLNDEGNTSSAIDLTATAGGFSVDGIKASNMTVASAADADDLTISVTGANDASLLLSSAGTGADAMSLDVSAGSMVVAPSLADGQTLKLGKASATEMTFSPNSSAGNEKISLVNTAGTAADAIKIQSAAGGIAFDAYDATTQMASGYIELGKTGEFETFVGKDSFNNNMSIIGALNALADAGEPTKFIQRVTGSHSKGADLYFNSMEELNTGNHIAVGGYLTGSAAGFRTGTASSIAATLEPHRADVFLNGQLLMSGSLADVTGSNVTADYNITAASRIKFGFALQADDVIQVIDRS